MTAAIDTLFCLLISYFCFVFALLALSPFPSHDRVSTPGIVPARGAQLAGLILENTFTSLRQEAAFLLPRLRPFMWALIPNAWCSRKIIQGIHIPVLMITGLFWEVLTTKWSQQRCVGIPHSPTPLPHSGRLTPTTPSPSLFTLLVLHLRLEWTKQERRCRNKK